MAIQEHLGVIFQHAGGAVKDAAIFAKNFLEDVFRHEMSLDEIAQVYNEEIDKMIIQDITRKNLTYVGGSFVIKYVSSETFSMSMELYYQNIKKEWKKRATDSAPQSVKYLTPEAREELASKKELKYEINAPEMDDTVVSEE